MLIKKQEQLDRKSCPHHVVITFKIDVRKIHKDGTLDHQVIGNKILCEYGISNKAQLCFSAANEAEAIKILKKKLKRLEDEKD
jgi:hypothetical protein